MTSHFRENTPVEASVPEQDLLDLKSFVTYRVSRLQSLLNVQSIRLLKQHSDLALTEWRVLLVTGMQNGATLSEIVRSTKLDKGQLSRAISSLVEKRLMRTTVSEEDHRQHDLSLTSEGRHQYDKLRPIMRARQNALVEDVSLEELETMYAVFDKLEKALSEHETMS